MPKLEIGSYRPIYLWAGPGTIRMNKIKFMDFPVDEIVHREAHFLSGAKGVVEGLFTNWVHLTYNWGFPPEIEIEDWEDFRRAADNYHQVGSPVFAYIQSSNCVFEGSFKSKDWYVRDPKGRKVHYYSGRYMVDWTHPEWIQHLKGLIAGAIERGADGIFFDNLWYGQQPSALMGAWVGGAGCYCERCQALYRAETGESIPRKILPERDEVADYIRWRAKRVTATLQTLADEVHRLKPDALISANDYDVTMRNSYLVYGLDVEALAKIQDVVMVENFALPRWDVSSRARLANNALTIRNTRELVRDQAHLSVLSYDVGIGFDPVYPPRRHQQGIAEAAACGASMTIKGTEYNDGNRMTLLTDPVYAPQQQAIGEYNRWLSQHKDLYQDGINTAPVGLMHPGEDLWQHWMSLAPIYCGTSQALTAAGIPWRVVRQGDSLAGLSTLLTFTPSTNQIDPLDDGIRQVHIPSLPGWGWRKASAAAKGGIWHDVIEMIGLSLLRAYHSSKLARRLLDRLNMVKLVTQTALFDLPSQTETDTLLNALPQGIFPIVQSGDPVLIETWTREGQQQVHLVNYSDYPQAVTVAFGEFVHVDVISTGSEEILSMEGESVSFELDLYAVLLIQQDHRFSN